MVFSLDIRRIKQESYRIIRQDGLSDICGGLMLGIMAIFFLDFRYAGALIVGCAMQTIVLPACRKKITYPRVGYAKFPGRADIKSLVVWDIAVPLAIVGLIICTGMWARSLLALCLGIFLAALALPGARITKYFLDYILVTAFLVSGIIGQLFVWRGSAPGSVVAVQFWILSGLLIFVGLVQLQLFLQKYPEPIKEVFNDHAK
jgi:hypothetical protein